MAKTNRGMEKHQDQKLFYDSMEKYMKDSRIRLLENYSQHRGNTTYRHVVRVARRSFALQNAFHVDADVASLVRGALLHDYYLYSTSEKEMSAYQHGTTHARRALMNAQEVFELNDTEKDIIYSHMWPLNLTHVPKTKEAWLVCAADKLCAMEEFLFPGKAKIG